MQTRVESMHTFLWVLKFALTQISIKLVTIKSCHEYYNDDDSQHLYRAMYLEHI